MTYPRLTSMQNPKLKLLKKLQQRKAREQSGLLLIETPHPIEEAVKAGFILKELYLIDNQSAPFKVPANTELYWVPESVMDKLGSTDSAPVCIGVFIRPHTGLSNLSDLKSKTTPALLILDRLQDPGNVGTLIRCAAAFGCTGIITTAGTTDPYSPKVIRSSAGHMANLPIVTLNDSLDSLLNWLATEKIYPYFATCHPEVTINYQNADFKKPFALIMGAEGSGIDDAIVTQSGGTGVMVPMAEGIDSLNVSISGGIILAEAFQQRRP